MIIMMVILCNGEEVNGGIIDDRCTDANDKGVEPIGSISHAGKSVGKSKGIQISPIFLIKN